MGVSDFELHIHCKRPTGKGRSAAYEIVATERHPYISFEDAAAKVFTAKLEHGVAEADVYVMGWVMVPDLRPWQTGRVPRQVEVLRWKSG